VNSLRYAVVGIIGLGFVGQPTVAALANVGYQVIGMDTDHARITKLAEEGDGGVYEPGLTETLKRWKDRIRYTTSHEDVMKADAVLITVGTPTGADGKVSHAAVDEVADRIAPFLRKGHLVVLRSTVAPGTTRQVATRLGRHSGLKPGDDFHVAYSPERTIEGIALPELYSLPNIIGGIEQASTEACAALLGRLGTIGIRVSSPEVAELCKLSDNTFRAVNIALANELGQVFEKAGIDAYEVVDAVARAYSRTQLFRPGLGADGPCLSKDPIILETFASEIGASTPVLASARKTNESSTRRVADEVLRFSKQAQSGLIVSMLGLAFKGRPETNDTRGSPAQFVYKEIAASKAATDYRFFDPIVTQFNGHTVAGSLADAIRGSNVVLFLTDHSALRNIDASWVFETAARPVLVVDSWHNLTGVPKTLPDGVKLVRIGDGRCAS
jgi:nucleotide sugar dehydrogenase